MSKYCPECEAVFEDDVDRCPDDGTPLVRAARAATDSLVGQTLADRFEIIELLGAGGMGAVYHARQLSMQRDVAIKVLLPHMAPDRTATKRFFKEARAASQLAHANTITVFDFGQADNDLLFIAMELLRGRPLSTAMREDGAFSPERAAGVVAQVCDALTEAHEQGIIHRDLKPDNIFLVEQAGNPDFVKVLDFGIAKVPGGDGETQLTATGQTVGTPAYMSPEHARGEPLSPSSDLYALAAIAFELLAGIQPFRADSAIGLLLKHQSEPVPSVLEASGRDDLPPAMDAFMRRAMAKDAADRPQCAADFKEEFLAAVQAGAEEPARPLVEASLPAAGPTLIVDEVPTRAEGGGERGLGVALAAGVIVLAIVGLSYVIWTQLREPATDAPSPRAGPAAALSEEITEETGTRATASQTAAAGTREDTDEREGASAPDGDEQSAGAEEPEEPRTTVITVTSDPLGAQVSRGGKVLGTTPFSWKAAPLGEEVELAFRLDGRLPSTLTLTPTVDGKAHAALKRAPAKRKVATRRRPRRRAKKTAEAPRPVEVARPEPVAPTPKPVPKTQPEAAPVNPLEMGLK